MAGLTPLPPTVTHTTTRLTHREAHDFLSSFLSRAEIDAAYRPDSTLAERGPQALSTGSSPNLTLHHLKRILLGMEGKRIGKQVFEQEGEGAFEEGEFGQRNPKRSRGDGEEQYEDDEQDTNGAKRRSINHRTTSAGLDIEDGDGPALVAHPHANTSSSPHPRADGHDNDGDDWQEKETYELAQSSEGLELTNEDRHPGADLPQPVDGAEEEELVAVEHEQTGELVDPRIQPRGDASGTGKGKTTVDKDERKRLKKLKAQAEKSKREEGRKGKNKATGF